MTRTRRHMLVLNLGRTGLEVVHVRRAAGGTEVLADAAVRLRANLVGDPPDVIGQELRQGLRQEGLLRRDCIVAIPPSWMVMGRTVFPDVPIADDEEFLRLQAEQHLPAIPGRRALASACDDGRSGPRQATLFGISLERLERVRAVCRGAGLRLHCAVPMLLQLPSGQGSETRALLAPIGTGYVLQVNTEHTVALLREIQGNSDGGNGGGDRVGRELRIALAQLKPDVLAAARHLEWRGTPAAGRELARRLAGSVPGLPPLAVSDDAHSAAVEAADAALAAADRKAGLRPFEAGDTAGPTTSLGRRALTRRRAVACLIAILALAGAWFYPAIRVRGLRNQLAEHADVAAAADAARTEIRQEGPWYDRTPRALAILRDIAEAFPRDGTVWTSRISIRDGNNVLISGSTTRPQDWLAMQEALRKSPRLHDVRVTQTREGDGDNTMDFTISFNWAQGGRQ